ncbi:MAG: LPS assembly lipoprotein LptE [Xanthomonadales bacterium]|nr:LPS assembly lipoprotein LptE [Xanthomonadales bacterium]
MNNFVTTPVVPHPNFVIAQASFSPAARAHLLPELIRGPPVCAKTRIICVGFLLTLCLLLSACGFQLRETAQLPLEMQNTQLLIGDEYSQLARRVRIDLEQAGVKIVNQDSATAILEIPKNEVLTEVLSIGDNARVREYRITHTVQFRLTDMQGKDIVPLQTIRQSREISFDEQQILAVSREQEYVKDDLANTLSRLLLSRLEIVGSQS